MENVVENGNFEEKTRKMYTIKEVAQRLEINEMTVRRRIQKGEIKAEKIKGAYGDQWMIPADQFTDLATQDIAVVPVTRQISVAELQAAFAHQIIEMRQAIVAEVKADVKTEVDGLRAELNAHFKQQDELIREAATKKRRWWQLW
jgi:excisionase family DNA binding protein